MAGYEKYDPRLESLVVETKTFWDPSVRELSPEDQAWLAEAVHKNSRLASRVRYERAHTGFLREITVTAQDIERLYEERFAT